MVDFERLNRIRRAMVHDYDSWTDKEKPSTCNPGSWLGVMQTILEMPVAPWNDPGSVVGEIGNVKSKANAMSNYGQTGEYDEALRRLDNTKPVDVKDPFIAEGDHVLDVIEVTPFGHTKHGPSAKAIFEVVESKTHPIGSRVVKLWFLKRPSMWPNQPTDSDRFADFVRKLIGADDPNTQVGQQCAALLRDRVPDQIARGMRLRAYGINTSKNPAKPFTDVRWTAVPQTQPEIAQRRAAIEAKLGAAPAPQAAPPAAYAPPQMPPQYAQQPPQGYGAPAPVTQPAGQWQQPNMGTPHFGAPAPQYQQPAPAPQPGVVQQSTTAPAAAPGSPLLSQIPGFNR